MNTDCLTTLVGLTDIECPCVEEEKFANWDVENDSESGYFLTDYEHGFPLLESIYDSENCGEGSIWGRLQKARSQAIGDFLTDLRAMIFADHEPRNSFSGVIGKLKHSIFQSGTTAQLRIRPRSIRNGKLHIKNIFLALNQTGVRQLTITSDLIGFESIMVDLYTTANSYHKNEVDITLPMWSSYSNEIEYVLSYELQGAQAARNKIQCCGMSKAYRNIMDIQGRTDNGVWGNYANGLAIEMQFKCDEIAWLCELEEIGGYHLSDVIARTIQFRGAAKLAAMVLESGQINYYTLLKREELYGKRNHLNKRYKQNLEWLVENMPKNDCLTCKSGSFWQTNSIVS